MAGSKVIDETLLLVFPSVHDANSIGWARKNSLEWSQATLMDQEASGVKSSPPTKLLVKS